MASADQPTVELRSAMLTDVGVVRDHNEDSAHVDPEHRFFIVADGMGGHAAGEVASAMAVAKVREALEKARGDIDEFASEPDEERRKGIVKVLEAAVRAAHTAVYERGTREQDKQGMGTTLDVVLVAGPEAFVAHVGDSRTYLMREGRAAQITTDHTVAEVLVIEGKLSLEEAQNSPLRTILVNAIGVAPDVGIEMAHVQLRKGDLILLCSDGLHDYFPMEQELADHLSRKAPEEALAELVSIAKERGGHDNITGIVVHVAHCDAAHDDAEDARVIAALEGTVSDGIPGTIERDDTLPLDMGVEQSTGERSYRSLKRKPQPMDLESTLEAEPPPPRPGTADSARGQREAGEPESSELDPALAGTMEIKAETVAGENVAGEDPATRPTEPMRAVTPPSADDAGRDPDFDAEKTLD